MLQLLNKSASFDTVDAVRDAQGQIRVLLARKSGNGSIRA
jgi:hypothetical protein